MADSAIAITAGSGTSVDTRTEGTNGNHRQVIVIGDPATNTGVASVDATNGVSVTLTTAIPTGSNTIGKLAANSGVDIGDVDVTSSVLPTGASTLAEQQTQTTALQLIDNIVHTEDEASSDGHSGALVLARRTDSPANTSGANLDYEALQMSAGRLWTSATVDAALPTGTNSIGQVTANAGTNLNTSALALESGGNLAGAATSLAILDDWDESDRAKVNVIVGQAGVAGGVGASGATTQRVVQANDSGKTLVSAGGSASSSGNNTLISAGSNKLKVYAFSLSTTSTTAVTCIFQSGASGTELWRAILQAPSGANTGANLAVAPPASLFATASATLLNLNLSAAVAVHWSVSYFDEA